MLPPKAKGTTRSRAPTTRPPWLALRPAECRSASPLDLPILEALGRGCDRSQRRREELCPGLRRAAELTAALADLLTSLAAGRAAAVTIKQEVRRGHLCVHMRKKQAPSAEKSPGHWRGRPGCEWTQLLRGRAGPIQAHTMFGARHSPPRSSKTKRLRPVHRCCSQTFQGSPPTFTAQSRFAQNPHLQSMSSDAS